MDNMNILELNDLHIDVLAKLMHDVRKTRGINTTQYRIANNILNQIRNNTLHRSSGRDITMVDYESAKSSVDERLDCIESNIKMMIGNGLLTNENRIVKLESNLNAVRNTEYVDLLKRMDIIESLVSDLATVYNKHSIKGVDD